MKTNFPKFLLALIVFLTFCFLLTPRMARAETSAGNNRVGVNFFGVLGNKTMVVDGAANSAETPALSINNVTLVEGNTGTTIFYFIVSLSEASSETITVNYATADGTATFADDYQAISGSLTFAPGELSKLVAVAVNSDTEIEPDETFTVNLSGATNAIIANGVGTGTIRNDDDNCTYTILPPALNTGASESSGNTIFVTTQPGCTFTATTSDSFITITSIDNGLGIGTVRFTVAANTGAARTGAIIIAGQTFVINQAAVGNLDLRVSITDSPDPVTINDGQDITYTIVVSNDGGSPATSVILTDTLPAGLNFVSFTATQGSCTQSERVVSCNLGVVITGATVTITARPTVPGTFTNTVSVVSNEQDPDTSNNTASTTTAVNAQPDAISTDLRVIAFDSPGVPVALGSGQNIIYTIVVDNDGRSPATGVVVTSALPASVNVISATTSDGSCSIAPGLVTCNIGSLIGGAVIYITARPTVVGIVNNTISVRGNEFDPITTNNSITLTSRVNPPLGTVNADLRVTLLEPLSNITVGSLPDIVYEIFVNNDGPSPATGVILTNVLPSGATFISATTSQGMCSQANGVVTCDLGTVTGRVAITITGRPTAAGIASNTVSVRGNEPDFNLANNSATVAVAVRKSNKRARFL